MQCAPGGALAGTLIFSAAGSRGQNHWPRFMAGSNSGEVRPLLIAMRAARAAAGRSTFATKTRRPISASAPFCTPDGPAVSQSRQVRQRSRCSCVLRAGSAPWSNCFMRSLRPHGPSGSSPSSWQVGQVAVQKPQCTHLCRIA